MPFYRTPFTRWSFIVTGLFVIYALSPLGADPWRETPSLRWLHRFFPWPVLIGLMCTYVLLLLWGAAWPTLIADGIGLVVYGWELVALLWTLDPSNPTNPLAIAAVALAAAYHFAALRLVVFQVFGIDYQGAR